MPKYQWTHRGNLALVKRSFLDGNHWAPYDALEYCRAEKKATVPAWAIDAVVADYRVRRRKEGDRRNEARWQQRSQDAMILCLAKNYGYVKGLKTAQEMFKIAEFKTVENGYRRAVRLAKAGKLYATAAENLACLQKKNKSSI